MAVHRSLIGALCALGLVACSAAAANPDPTTIPVTSDGGTSSSSTTAPLSTVGGVGNLPGPLPTAAVDEIASTTTLPPPAEEVGTLANGNRILMLGDSILASTARRYTNNMCKALVPLGWQVEVEAEVSRGVDFGQKVQKALTDPPWDAGLIFLGNNFNDDQHDFFVRYNDLIVKFGDVPVVVVTLTEFEDSRAQLNSIIRNVAAAHPNVTVLDWAQIGNYKGVRGDDGLHLTDTGREVLAQAVASVLGVAPTQPGKCLDSKYTDDSAGTVTGGTSGGSGGNGKPTATTLKPTSTTVKPGSTTTTPGSTGSTTPGGGTTGTTTPGGGTTGPTTGSTNPPSTTPPATNPPPTNPPATNPPATNPPPTNPPPTNPPQTEPPPP